MGLLSALSDLLPGGVGLAGTIYNIATNKRDFDYQKALQQQIFEREDTAVQRRAEDLRAAGLNPVLAQGSAASAGSVVARSNTNDVNFGAALDAMSALQQIKSQKLQNNNAVKEGEILDEKLQQEYYNSQINFARTLSQLGIPYQTVANGGEFGTNPSFSVRIDRGFHTSFDNYIDKQFEYQNIYNKNAADIIQKNNAWYVADKALGIAGDLMPFINLYKKIK